MVSYSQNIAWRRFFIHATYIKKAKVIAKMYSFTPRSKITDTIIRQKMRGGQKGLGKQTSIVCVSVTSPCSLNR